MKESVSVPEPINKGEGYKMPDQPQVWDNLKDLLKDPKNAIQIAAQNPTLFKETVQKMLDTNNWAAVKLGTEINAMFMEASAMHPTMSPEDRDKIMKDPTTKAMFDLIKIMSESVVNSRELAGQRMALTKQILWPEFSLQSTIKTNGDEITEEIRVKYYKDWQTWTVMDGNRRSLVITPNLSSQVFVDRASLTSYLTELKKQLNNRKQLIGIDN